MAKDFEGASKMMDSGYHVLFISLNGSAREISCSSRRQSPVGPGEVAPLLKWSVQQAGEVAAWYLVDAAGVVIDA